MKHRRQNFVQNEKVSYLLNKIRIFYYFSSEYCTLVCIHIPSCTRASAEKFPGGQRKKPPSTLSVPCMKIQMGHGPGANRVCYLPLLLVAHSKLKNHILISLLDPFRVSRVSRRPPPRLVPGSTL